MHVKVHGQLLKEAVVETEWATELEGAVMSVSISLCEGMEWATEKEGAVMSVSISLCEGMEWATEKEGAAMSVSISLCEGVEDRERRGCHECFHIPV